ncbi:MAG: hypothetical protein ACYC2G_13865 [Gemmatimonadaceae bacterium]
MSAWLLAVGAGVALALVGYAGRVSGGRAPLVVGAAVTRGVSTALLVALLLDAPLGPATPPPPLVALDVSASWTRGGEGGPFRAAADDARTAGGGALLLLGDSVREGSPPAEPADRASRVAPAVERAVGAGRPLMLFSDGVVEDAPALDRLPRGSVVRVPPARALLDGAPLAIDAPRAVVGGDTIRIAVRVGAAARALPGGVVRLLLDAAPLDTALLDTVPAWGEQRAVLRAVMPAREGAAVLRAVVAVTGDEEPRNDTLAVAIELSTVAGVTVVSTAPDFDLRYMLEVLRGTTALPTRAFLQVSPGQWRREGSLAPVGVEVVRDAARRAPILVLHGDTAAFGAPAGLGAGAQLLVPGAVAGDPQWYAVAAPPSPLAALLSGTAWDSLPPLAVGATVPRGEWVGLTIQRGRQFERQAAIAGTEAPRRRAVVGVSGLWRWRFRGGVAADAFAAVWGGIFDWMAAERRDTRAALPDASELRAGEPVVWLRGGADSVVNVVLRRRGAADTDSMPLTLAFGGGSATTRSPGLAAGVYDLVVAGGRAVLVVNASRELLPVRPTVAAGPVGQASASVGTAPRARGAVWPYVLLVLLLCAEWLLRRRAGLR